MYIKHDINLQENETTSKEIVSFKSNALFDLNIDFDSTLGFTAFNVFE